MLLKHPQLPWYDASNLSELRNNQTIFILKNASDYRTKHVYNFLYCSVLSFCEVIKNDVVVGYPKNIILFAFDNLKGSIHNEAITVLPDSNSFIVDYSYLLNSIINLENL